MPWTLAEHADADALAAACAARLGTELDEALRLRGRAVLAVAGGRTAPPILRRLAAQPRDWAAVTVVPTDERWVAAEHPDSNLHALREAFAGVTGLRWQPLVPPQPQGPPDAALANTAFTLFDEAFDAVLLGMGSDGHFASLFPGASTPADALAVDGRAAAVAVVPDPLPASAPHARVSLTLARLLRARCLLLAASGADKRAVLRRAAEAGADPRRWPVAALLHAPAAPLEIHWSP